MAKSGKPPAQTAEPAKAEGEVETVGGTEKPASFAAAKVSRKEESRRDRRAKHKGDGDSAASAALGGGGGELGSPGGGTTSSNIG